MKRVGTAELKNHLSHYLRQVRKGAEIVVTDRNEPIARLVPVPPKPANNNEAIMQRLVERGTAHPGPLAGKPLKPHKKIRLKNGESASELFIRWKDED